MRKRPHMGRNSKWHLKPKKLRGSLTVFFSMLLPVILLFMISLISYGKARLLSAGIRSDLELSALSTLAEYDQQLVKEYGLYAVRSERLEETFSFFLNHNSYHPYGSYRANHLSIVTGHHLGETQTLKEAICHFMEERVVVEQLQEIAALFSELGELEEVKKEYANYRHSKDLYYIQSLYQMLVTNVYGIRNDGGRNEYGVNLFLNGSVHLTELKNSCRQLLSDQEKKEEFYIVEEKALYEIRETKRLTIESEDLCTELKSLIEALEAEEREEKEADPSLPDLADELPVTASKLENILLILGKNRELLESAEQCLLRIESEETVQDLSPIDQLGLYDRSIRLPHEMEKAERLVDFSGLFEERFGVTKDSLTVLAPDENLSMDVSWKQAGNAEGADVDFDVLDLDLSGTLQEAKDQYFLVQYSLGMFRNLAGTYMEKEGRVQKNLRNDPISKRFLSNEAEYLAAGRSNEYENALAVQHRITALRTLLNMAYLLADTQKRTQMQELAASTGGILMPGLGNAIAFGVILTGWSLWEARLDYQMLLEGKRVELIKSDESWQSDLTLLLSGKDPEQKPTGKGMSYRQYLRIILWMTDEEQLLRRLQILISLNLQDRIDLSASTGAAGAAAETGSQGDLTRLVVSFSVNGTAHVEDGLLSVLDFHGTYGYD